MPALPETMKRERAGRGPRAIRYAASSCAHQREASNSAPLSRGHHVHVVSNQPEKGFSTVTPFGLLTLRLVPDNWRRFCRRPFPIHVSARGLSSRLSRKRVCSVPLGHTRAYSFDRPGANRSVVHSVAHQHSFKHFADAPHVSSIPSSIPSSVETPWTEGMPTSCQSLPKWSVK